MGQAESPIENYLIARCKEEKVLQWKSTSPGIRGIPDRFLAYKGNVIFVECKAPGKKPRKNQWLRIRELREHGIRAVYVDSKENVDSILHELLSLDEYNPWGEKREEIEERSKDAPTNNRVFKAPLRSM